MQRYLQRSSARREADFVMPSPISECDDLALVVKGLLLELQSRSELHYSRASASETRIALRDIWGLS